MSFLNPVNETIQNDISIGHRLQKLLEIIRNRMRVKDLKDVYRAVGIPASGLRKSGLQDRLIRRLEASSAQNTREV